MVDNARLLADAPEEKETPDTVGHRANSKSDHTVDDSLKACSKEVPAVDGILIKFHKDPKARASQIGIWAREGLRRTHRDKVAARAFAFTREFLIVEKGWTGWTCAEVAAWLECSESLIEKGMARIQKMGLVCSDDLLKRQPDGTIITEMRRVRPAMPADFAGPKPMVKLRPMPNHRSATVFRDEDKGIPPGSQGSSAACAKPLRNITSQANAPKEAFKKKRQLESASDLGMDFSPDELALIDDKAISESEINRRIDKKEANSRNHVIHGIRLSLSSTVGVKKGDPRWDALYHAIDHACRRETQRASHRADEYQKRLEALDAAKRLTPEQHFARWEKRWRDPKYHHSYWWWVGIDLPPEKMVSRARLYAARAFDRDGDDWVNQWPTYMERPSAPRWAKLPDELQQRAAAFVIAQNDANPNGPEAVTSPVGRKEG